jgi:hypothetical protein
MGRQIMNYEIKRSGLCDLEWQVYAPRYCGEVLLLNGLYRAQPYTRPGERKPWPVSHFSEIGLAADYLVGARL